MPALAAALILSAAGLTFAGVVFVRDVRRFVRARGDGR